MAKKQSKPTKTEPKPVEEVKETKVQETKEIKEEPKKENSQKNKEILFHKIRDVKDPTVGTSDSAGIDFYIPEFSAEFKEDLLEKNPTFNPLFDIKNNGQIIIKPGKSILIPAGLKMVIPKGKALLFVNKSGISTRLGLSVGACLIDADYRGEAHIHLFNHNTSPVVLECGQKIVQAIEISYTEGQDRFKLIDDKEFKKYDNTERGEGGFGSTGN